MPKQGQSESKTGQITPFCCEPVSRVLSSPENRGRPSFICAAYPPPYPRGNGACNAIRGLFGLTTPEVYPAAAIAPGTGGLLPHLFTLTPEFRGGCFLWHCLFPVVTKTEPLLSQGRMHCVARTFLTPKNRGAMVRFALQIKGKHFCFM